VARSATNSPPPSTLAELNPNPCSCSCPCPSQSPSPSPWSVVVALQQQDYCRVRVRVPQAQAQAQAQVVAALVLVVVPRVVLVLVAEGLRWGHCCSSWHSRTFAGGEHPRPRSRNRLFCWEGGEEGRGVPLAGTWLVAAGTSGSGPRAERSSSSRRPPEQQPSPGERSSRTGPGPAGHSEHGRGGTRSRWSTSARCPGTGAPGSAFGS